MMGIMVFTEQKLFVYLKFFIIKRWRDYNLKAVLGIPGWLSQFSIQLLISVQVIISGSWDGAPSGALH